ncbi:uncharacterized protein LOC129724631 isoform X1 [Wyeomyia smithii]|uniref:uncharacterized protein LOC129724631 isoform X1 n=1 Tax=Wyeomyia smithii TaxID=174621 RepID=UPI002467F82C|nr:uncharacterized protein LOC129724631 isoform X1 [Wyeomyia smithii]
MKLISITVLAVLLTVAAANTDEWNLLNNGESFLHDLVREKRQDASQNATEVADDDILNFILDSGRQGRSLEGFDEVYSDPSVQQALQNSDDVEARNIIKEKLCALGLMQCDGELIDGRRPYLNPQNLIYAQPVALRPVGRPIATVPIQGPQRPGPPPPSPQYIPKPPQPQPPQRPHQGPYGPPQPMPPPRPQQKVGFASHQPSYNRPNSFTGSSSYGGLYSSQSGSFSPYPSKPLGPIYEGGEIPYEFENPNKALIIGDGAPLVKPPVEQHIHHHYHHIEGGDKTAIASNPVPLSQGVLTESAVGGSSLTNSNLYSSSVYGSSGVPNGGFNPSASKDFDYQDLKGSSNTGYNQYSGYASQSKPVNPNVYNRGPATFASTDNIIYGSNPTGSGASGSSNSFNSGYQSSQGAYHTSNPNLYKKELNVNGLGTNQNSFATNYNKYSQQSNINSQYSHNQLGANSFGSQGAQYGGANPRVEECVCVPYEQCPAQDVVGRRDDLILPLDPRNFKTDIEADIERVVVTDGNGTMTVVHVSKNHTAQARSANVTEPVKKISKREAAANKKSDNDDDKAKVEPRLLGGGHHGGEGGGGKKVVPTFGVSFGLPYPSYPLNPYGPNPAVNPYFGSIGANGLNLGLVNVNPLFSLQVTKDEYGDKLLKPLVNLHVTPTENIVHKVGSLLAAKKQNILHVFNQHEHYHNHIGYPPPPPIYRPPHGPPHIHGPPSGFGPTGPNLIFTKPPGPVYTGPGPIYPRPPGPIYSGPPGPIYSGPPGPIYSGPPGPVYPGPQGPYGNRPPGPPFIPNGPGPSPPYYGPRPPFFRDATSASDVELDYNPNDIGRNANITFNQRAPPIGNFDYQSVYPQNQPDLLNQNRVDYGRQYQNYQSSNDRLPPTQNIPTPAPGHSEGSNIVSFPRSRRATDISVPDQLEPVQSNVVSAVSEEPAESGVQEKSFSAEKRQAYYGPQPQQCPQRTVCCRRPAYRPPPTHAKLGQCGVRNAQGINGRIKNPVYVDGDSEFGEYPWQVAILKKDPKESVYVCGGTLIDNQYIITAAHCVKTYNGFDLRVRLGEWDVNHDVEFYPYIERDVISVQVHPEYYAGTLDNDLAILKMDSPVDFSNTPHISPACLPDKYTDFSGQRCWTTGWGKDAFGDYGKYQNILKEVDVPIVNDQQCQAQLRQTRLGYQYKLHPGFVCAGGEEGKDACKGDGGGPLVCERNGSWQVVGVVSWGIGCGKANVPGVYVKVAYYLDWLQQVRGRY